MTFGNPDRGSTAPPRIAFRNLQIGSTTDNFVLPAGWGEMRVHMVDDNNPGTATLQTVVGGTTSTVGEVTTGSGDIPEMFGFLRFQTTGGTFNIATTIAAIDNVVIYFQE
jgi:hypothetical protein